MQFVVVAEHSPESCPTSNKQIRDLMREVSQQIPDLTKKLGVEIITFRVLGPDHQFIAIVEAADIEAVRDFLMQSRMVQWNTTTVRATWSLDEALAKAEPLPTLV
jgi:uncharacterized protein with GYD domain